MKRAGWWSLPVLGLLVAAAALVGGPDALSAEEASEGAREKASTIYQQRCTPCHGATGKGDGAAAAALKPKPRDLTDPEWQASVEDDYIEKIIAKGGAAVGKSPLMPPNPDLASQPEVVQALRELIRDMKSEE